MKRAACAVSMSSADCGTEAPNADPEVVMLPRFEVLTATGPKPVRYPMVLPAAAPGLVVHLAVEEDQWCVTHWASGKRLEVEFDDLNVAVRFAEVAARWCDFTRSECGLRGYAYTIRRRIGQWQRRQARAVAA